MSRDYSKNGIISLKKTNNILYKNSLKIKILDNDNLDHFSDFINKNYIKGYFYNKKILKWLISNSLCLGVRNDSRLIATITSRNINMIINNKFIELGYVDFLCVEAESRNKKIAPLLISNLVNKYPDNYSFVFKKEEEPLPFDYITKFYYYVYTIPNNTIGIRKTNIRKVQPQEIKQVFDFFQQKSKNYTFRINYDINEFRKTYFTQPNLVYNYVDIFNNKILNLFSFYLCDLNYDGKLYKIAELLFYFSEKNLDKVIRDIIIILKKLKVTYFSIPELANNRKLLDNLETSRGKICYIQMYNYGLRKNLLPSQVFFPLA